MSSESKRPRSETRPAALAQRPRLGISACLLGEHVRYDGGHKRVPFLTETLGRFVRWVPVCPEVECGLSVPREPMHLSGDPLSPRLLTNTTGMDLTTRMRRWVSRRLRRLQADDLWAFIFKSDSPCCGLKGVEIRDRTGALHRVGVGMFAGAFAEHFPLLPVEEERRLSDPLVRENFIDRIFCLKRYRDSLRRDKTAASLSAFHAEHRVTLLAHSPDLVRRMDRLVARARKRSPKRLRAEYETLLCKALALRATVRKNAIALRHCAGVFRRTLPADERQELRAAIGLYESQLVPLVVPLTLLQHYAYKQNEPYLKQQRYLNPDPIELALRCHA